MPWEFDLEDFEDGQGAHERYDALQDLKQSTLDTLHLDEYRHVQDILRNPGNFKVKLKGGFTQQQGEPKHDWGHVEFEIQKLHYAKIEGPLNLFVPRKDVWKQLPYLGKTSPRLRNPSDWTIDPPEKVIQQDHRWEKYKSTPMVQWAEETFGRKAENANKKRSLMDFNDHQFAKTFGLVGQALLQPHFRYFSKIIVTGQGYHTSRSDPDMHATIKLENSKLTQEGKFVTAHIYNDEDCQYVGHRIFIGSALEDEWSEIGN